jgi:hypothetical protein
MEVFLKLEQSGMVVHACNPSTQGQKQEDHEIQASLDYTARSYFKKNKGGRIHLI